jgi:D-glycero-D-manno-heptose 1,7-bisphosphate phosphatase
LTPTAFLDRDGTINVKPPDGEYVTRPEDLVLLPRAADAIARLNAAEWLAIVVTNQRGVSLGRMSDADLASVHRRLESELAEAGARLDGIYACVHGDGECDCRKPATGLFAQARAEHPDIDLATAVVIGDSWRDMRAAATLGSRRLLIAKSVPGEPDVGVPVDQVVPSLWDAVDWALGADAVTEARTSPPPAG